MSKVITTEYVISKCKEVHGDTYEYFTTKYVSAKEKLEIYCKVHSKMFYQMFSEHKIGQGCPECGLIKRNNTQRGTLEDFIARANIIHNNSYDYNKSLYTKYHDKLLIGCRIHGDFYKSPAKHLSGQGCPTCAKVLMGNGRMSCYEFIAKARSVFGDLYDYDISRYVKSSEKIDIGCRIHGRYSITPNNHLRGKGCPSCANYGYSPRKQGILYILKCGDMTKVGITNLQASKRASKISKSYGAEFQVVKEYKFEDGAIPDKIETLLLQSLKKTHKQPTAKFEGHSECFMDVNLPTLLIQIETLIGELNGN